MYGFGQASACVNGYDQYGQACTDFTPITSNPTLTAEANAYLTNPLLDVPDFPLSFLSSQSPVIQGPTSDTDWGLFALIGVGVVFFMMAMKGGR